MQTAQLERIQDGTTLRFGAHNFVFGKDAVELTDSSSVLSDTAALRSRMESDGYLFIRGFHPAHLVEAARNRVLDAIAAKGGIAPGTRVPDGICVPGAPSHSFFRDVAVAHSPEVLDVVDGPHTFDFFKRFLGGPVLTFDKRWLRAMGPGGSNHFHYDSAYVGRGTSNRYTMWSAFTDIDLENGPLALCVDSHRHERLKATYGQIDMDRDLVDAVFSADAREMVDRFGFKLATAHFQPGDCVIFGLHMMHSSVPNTSDRYRISIDTRYQLAREASDERFHGPKGTWLGNFYNKGATLKPMAEMRREWGL